jgi:hypothetical protein
MHRSCTSCDRPFTGVDLAREVTKGMEAERKALGLGGVFFRYYECPACGQSDIFVDLRPLLGERPDEFQNRRRQLEATVRELHPEQVEVVLTARRSGECTDSTS